MSSEKELFSAGISKCEKILKILLPEDVFKIKEIEAIIKSMSNQNLKTTKERRQQEIRRKKSCVSVPVSKSQNHLNKDLVFLNRLAEKITSQKEGITSTKKILRVAEIMQDYINNKEKLIKNLK